MKTILIVDDEYAVVDVLSTILEDEGYRVTVADNGRVGLETLAKDRPDLVLCDMMMPLLDGLQMCRAMQADVRYADIPFVLMSAAQNPAKASDCAYTTYMPKPFDYTNLLEMVERLIGPAGDSL